MFFNRLWYPYGDQLCTSLSDLFVNSYEADFIQSLLKSDKSHLAKSFNFTSKYIDDVMSLNNSSFGDFIDAICPEKLEIKDTTDADNQGSWTCHLNLIQLIISKSSYMTNVMILIFLL